jgi:hypothetical protein
MRISEVGVQLYRAIEELEGSLVFLLQGIAVADDAPSLRGEERLLERVVGETAELNLLLEVPETGGVVLEAFQATGIHFYHLRVHLLGVLVFAHLKVALGHLTQYPTSSVLSFRESSEYFDALLALVETEILVSRAEHSQQAHEL